MHFKFDIKRSLALLLIPLVLLLVLSSILNYHAHNLAKGGVYVHTHSHSSDGDDNSTKSDKKDTSEDCVSLKHIFSVSFVFFKSIKLIVSEFNFSVKETNYISSFKVSNISLLLPNRAPPFR